MRMIKMLGVYRVSEMSIVLSKEVALEFCNTCNWAYESWLTHRNLFDDNTDIEDNLGQAKYFSHRLSVMTQEYTLLQITKLHDPAIMKNSLNLTLEYILRFGGWNKNTDEVGSLKLDLDELYHKIKKSRNKVIAHNDLETIMRKDHHGEFAKDLDTKYFEKLQEFVNIVHDKFLEGPFPFNDLAQNDVIEFLNVLSSSKK